MRFNFVVVDKGSVGAVQVHHVELDSFPFGLILPGKKVLHFTHLITAIEVLPREWNQSVLKNGVLFATARNKTPINCKELRQRPWAYLG